MKKFKYSLHGLLNNNKFLLVISLLIAIGIWVTVSPQRDMTINCPVKISTKNSSAEKLGLEIIDGKEQTISVTVLGEWYNISELTAEDINISYSFTGVVDPGEYDVAITATKANSTADFTIESVTPEKVKVTMDHISTVTYPIEVVTNNITAEDGLIVGTPIVDNEKGEIEITGPATKLKKLDRVVAEINVEETLSKSKIFTSELKFLNKNGKEIDVTSFTLPYNEVDVIVPINQTKTVDIEAKFVNLPEAYKAKPVSYTVSQNSIELIGTKEALDKIDKIELDPIDYKELTPTNNEFNMKLNLPSGVTTSNGVTDVTVTVNVSGFASKTMNISKFNVVNVKKSTVATVETEYKSVTVVGPRSVIDNIENSDVYIECDMSKSAGSSGSVTVEGTVKSSKYKTIWGTGDCDIRIKVKES
ncbi:MAG: YbbR-like domain-containing protein [Acutalibacteraceae bacterium]